MYTNKVIYLATKRILHNSFRKKNDTFCFNILKNKKTNNTVYHNSIQKLSELFIRTLLFINTWFVNDSREIIKLL